MLKEAIGNEGVIVVVLDVPDEVCQRRIGGRRVDPETGKTYHLDFNPPPPSISSRLIIRGDDTEETIQKRLKVFHEQTEEVTREFERVVEVDGDRNPDLIFSSISEILNETIRSLQIDPTGVKNYLQTQVDPILTPLLEKLAIDQPDNVEEYIINYLSK